MKKEAVTVTARLQVAIVAMDINHDRKSIINDIILQYFGIKLEKEV